MLLLFTRSKIHFIQDLFLLEYHLGLIILFLFMHNMILWILNYAIIAVMFLIIVIFYDPIFRWSSSLSRLLTYYLLRLIFTFVNRIWIVWIVFYREKTSNPREAFRFTLFLNEALVECLKVIL